jgi:hypothetical protein
MSTSGQFIFQTDSFEVSTDANGRAAWLQPSGACVSSQFYFEYLTIGICGHGLNASSPPTDTDSDSLSVNIPEAEFEHLRQCLCTLPSLLTISYTRQDTTLFVTGLKCGPVSQVFQVNS